MFKADDKLRSSFAVTLYMLKAAKLIHFFPDYGFLKDIIAGPITQRICLISMYELLGFPATRPLQFPNCLSMHFWTKARFVQMPLYFTRSAGINPITSSWKSRDVKQIGARKQPEMAYIIQQQAISYVQLAKNNVYPLNDKLRFHSCHWKFKRFKPLHLCAAFGLLKLAFSVAPTKK